MHDHIEELSQFLNLLYPFISDFGYHQNEYLKSFSRQLYQAVLKNYFVLYISFN